MGVGRMKSKQLTILNEKPDKIAHDDLCLLAGKWLRKQRYLGFVTVNNWLMYNDEKPDVIGFNKCGGGTTVIEIKVSRADFKHDRHKPFRINEYKGMGNYRYYCCPDGLIDIDELPYGWGLIIWNNGEIVKVVDAQHSKVKNRKAETYMLNYYLRFPDKFNANLVTGKRFKPK